MLTICQLCGDKGYSRALIFCEKCEEYAIHGYCMDVLPEVDEENVTWFCEDCKPDAAKQPSIDKLRYPPFKVLKETETVRTNRPCGPIKKNQKFPSVLVSKNKLQMCEGKPSYNELQCRENGNEDQKFRKRQKLVHEDDAKPLNTFKVCVSDFKPSNIVEESVITNHADKSQVRMHDSLPSGNVLQSCRKQCRDPRLKKQQESKPLKIHDKDPRLRKQGRLVIENTAKPLEVSQVSDTLLKSSNVLQEKVVGSSVATIEVQIHDSTSKPSGNEPESKEKRDSKFRKKQMSLVESVEAEPLKTIEVAPTDPNPSNILEYNCCVEAKPLLDPMWRGSFVIYNKESECIGRILVAAHLSTLACPKVCETRDLLPELVSLELSTRSHCWPIRFQRWGPSYHSIGLFCLPDNRDDKAYDSLVYDMINGDFAMRASLENAELLVFASNVLPLHYKMFQSKYYLWGLFRDRQASGVRTVATRGMKGNPKFSTSHRQSPITSFSHSGKEGGIEDNPRKVDKIPQEI
ncbi:PHD finger-containing protein 1-like isoform X2 [Humulus lupulus]|uniref:PHD finger-containing protein 1-like isoform X2 n=1 Tax=Humulus lupulus TaxID=3486 RepID=UPI002B405F9F|nr:PHD finger-containing protein 1-like isoform X2 [Humulus lupulus]